jgi:hypothetical protein
LAFKFFNLSLEPQSCGVWIQHGLCEIVTKRADNSDECWQWGKVTGRPVMLSGARIAIDPLRKILGRTRALTQQRAEHLGEIVIREMHLRLGHDEDLTEAASERGR